MQEDAAAATPDAQTPAAPDATAAEPGAPAAHPPPTNLESILDELGSIAAKKGEGEVSVADVMAELGERSFGPLLLVPSLIGLSPIGAIPFLPAVMVAIEILVIVQMLAGLKHFWIPPRLARQHINARRLARGLDALRKPARIVDGFVSPRLGILIEGPFFIIVTVTCLLVAFVTPVIELVPIAGIVPNAAVVAFALAITARDGLWTLIGFAITGGCGWLIAQAL